MEKFTSGPWFYRGTLGPHSAPHLLGPYIIENSDGTQLASVTGWRNELNLANARLISASPDLYFACSAALNLLVGHVMDGSLGHHPDNPGPTMLRNALAKAGTCC